MCIYIHINRGVHFFMVVAVQIQRILSQRKKNTNTRMMKYMYKRLIKGYSL